MRRRRGRHLRRLIPETARDAVLRGFVLALPLAVAAFVSTPEPSAAEDPAPLTAGAAVFVAFDAVPEPSSTTSTSSTTTTSTTTTTVFEPGPELQRAADLFWSKKLTEALNDLVAEVNAVPAHAGSEAETVLEMFEQAKEAARQLSRSLDRVVEANDHLIDLTAEARRDGFDASAYSQVTVAVSDWVYAMRVSAEPYACRHLLPPGAGEWHPSRLADYQPYLDCLASEVTPKATLVAERAVALAEVLRFGSR